MTEATAVSARTVRGLAIVMLVMAVAVGALLAFAAVDTGPGGSRVMFSLLTAALLVAGIGAVAALVAVRIPQPWTVVVVVAVVVSWGLIFAASTRDGGAVLPLVMLPVLLMEWWLIRGLRRLDG